MNARHRKTPTAIFASALVCVAANCHSDAAEFTSSAWSMGIDASQIKSPYNGEGGRTEILPSLNYHGENWFIDGAAAGWQSKQLLDGFNTQLFARYHFGAYSEKDSEYLQGMRRYASVDGGVKVSTNTFLGELSAELSHDLLNRHQGYGASIGWRQQWQLGNLDLTPWLAVDAISSETNQYYFGVETSEANAERPIYQADSSVNLRAGIESWYAFNREHHVGLGLSYTAYGAGSSDSPLLDSATATQLTLGYRYQFNNYLASQVAPQLANGNWLAGEWDWRVAGGYWKDGNLVEMIYLNNMAVDTSSTRMVSGFLSKKISEAGFGLPVDMYITGGLVRHFEAGLQDDFNEYVFGTKGYYNGFPWSHLIETRLGFGYGFSYGEKVSFEEAQSVIDKNINSSRLLQYLDYSVDVNLGDLFKAPSIKHCYAGYSIHHRSGVFGKAEIFNNVNGGSNWNTFYLQCKLRP